MQRAETIRVRGVVQGVGFRPTVWRIARDEGIRGEVLNDAEGVLINAWGSAEQLDRFVLRLRSESPPLAVVASIERVNSFSGKPPDGFSIVASVDGETRTGVAADAACCPDCLAEVMDAADRRYRYPFTNCTHCGPRLSIIAAVPYDRANTSMAVFSQCPDCQAEYQDPADRRFHAQPNACPICGPRVWIEERGGNRPTDLPGADPIEQAAALLQQGEILAIKGIGGIHLACDAGNETTVARLRDRKQRYHKAFALMARDAGMAADYARLGEEERALLSDRAAPIVILEAAGERLAAAVAPGQATLGFMLPYTPLHHLLMNALQRPIVLTSGNSSDEPQCIDNQDARERLAAIADYWLLHDREILNRLDDSVVRVVNGSPLLLRRGRGYAPEAIALPEGFEQAPPLIAMGGELKNTFCLVQGGQVVLSQHMGDLENVPTLEDYRHNIQLYLQLFDCQPERVAVDMHPNYLATTEGIALAESRGWVLQEVQHHHAHIAGCMAERGIPLDAGQVLGIALDGLGFGLDGTIWGGEFMLADYRGFERLACFAPVAMPGGVKAIYEPWRNTLAHLDRALGVESLLQQYPDLNLVQYLKEKPIDNLRRMIKAGLNSPLASSCGRLFDAVAGAIGVCPDQAGYEGQAAVEMESLAAPAMMQESENGYPHAVQEQDEMLMLDWGPLWLSLLGDLRSGTDRSIVAARFHQGLAAAVSAMAVRLCAERQLSQVVLSGGVFQNRLLLERLIQLLNEAGLKVHHPIKTPANDGGLSLGQAVVAAANALAGEA